MITLGLAGLFIGEDEVSDLATRAWRGHDAAACLIRDGETLVAIEEERLNREKHTFRFPTRSIRECVRIAGIEPHQIDNVAFYFGERYVEDGFSQLRAEDPQLKNPHVRAALEGLLEDALGRRFSQDDITFESHHESHAASAFYDSGYEQALVLVSDGNGEGVAASLYSGEGRRLELLASYPTVHSLGHFYTVITKMLGYRLHDEYKVMGLAAFGDPKSYRDFFSDFLSLLPEGRYSLDHAEVFSGLIAAGIRPRRAEDPLTQEHKDLAAAAQEVLELITGHILRHWVAATGHSNLCIAGGVAQNTTLNGRILESGIVKSVFIPHAAHDAGGALGAAMVVQQRLNGTMCELRNVKGRSTFTSTAFLGPAIEDGDDLSEKLLEWHQFIEFSKPETSIAAHVAARLSDGAIVGWVQGRSEFGPRALGNRSILADPRPPENRDRVNRLIKEREDYRPFAPVVADSHADTYFDLTKTEADHRFMGFVVRVRDEHRATLGATTHVNGTSRVQVLYERDNPMLWQLINEFRLITDVPVLLNTSFNNNAEPIVDSVHDAVATLLTAGLDLLAVGPYIVTRRTAATQIPLSSCAFELMPLVSMSDTVTHLGRSIDVGRPGMSGSSISISPSTFGALVDHLAPEDLDLAEAEQERIFSELRKLWNRRLIRPIRNSGLKDGQVPFKLAHGDSYALNH